MALGEMQFYSPALAQTVTFTVYVPDPERVGSPPYPALLQLHGASDNHTAWTRRSKLVTYLEPLPLIAVMPSGGLSYWSNHRLQGPGTRYEDFLMEDLLPACEHFFPVREGQWAIGGLSMGGYGAIRLGLKYPERFTSIYAHSSVIVLRSVRDSDAVLTQEQRADMNLETYADLTALRSDRPRLSFDCGTEDPLLDQNRSFHAHLEAIGYPHAYHEFPGGHTWPYWDEHVQEALRQHVEMLTDMPQSIPAT